MISFRPVTAEDLPMLADWLARPHWRQWWGEPEEELNNIRDMVEGRDTTRPLIFQEGGLDKGYIQIWFVGDQQASEIAGDYPWLDLLPAEAVGVDLSIAAEEDLSRGLGTRTLQAFVSQLRKEGHERIIIDPDPANLRAVKAYRKAGFQEIEALLGRTGDCLLMELVSTEGVS